MGTCRRCNRSAKTISGTIGFCADCIRGHFDDVWPKIKEVHDRSRRPYGLPLDPPRQDGGARCRLCMHGCQIPEGSNGFCGLRRARSGKVSGGRPHEGNLSYYYDKLPTNCVASFVCPAGTDVGYPRYSVARGPEYGYKNLAVFYEACSFNCLYCQNYHFKERTSSVAKVSSKELARAVDPRTTCICYFGGDPTPQVLHALKTSRLALEGRGDKVLRICWETNGAARWPYLEAMVKLSLESGGCVKIDLKAWDNRIHRALCGVDNLQVLANLEKLSGWTRLRPAPPLLVASTLLVPGYVDEAEVGALAVSLARLDPEIPYSLLAFHPMFFLRDLPPTSTSHALGCLDAARGAGLRRVHLGNTHLLGDYY
ncbi:MAG: radical SAM protein [Thermodesulfobacteriota bacterium]